MTETPQMRFILVDLLDKLGLTVQAFSELSGIPRHKLDWLRRSRDTRIDPDLVAHAVYHLGEILKEKITIIDLFEYRVEDHPNG